MTSHGKIRLPSPAPPTTQALGIVEGHVLLGRARDRIMVLCHTHGLEFGKSPSSDHSLVVPQKREPGGLEMKFSIGL